MKSFKIGSIVLATDQGLGVLAKSFYDHGMIDKVLVQPHSSRENHYDWYPNRVTTKEALLDGIDYLLFFETPFDWKIIPEARKKGIKTVFMPMYECTQYPFPYEPDLIICPSLLDLDYYRNKNSYFIPVPVEVEWKERKKAKVFIHNAGNGGLGGRNGSKELIEAMEYVKSPIKLIINSQIPLKIPNDKRITLNVGTKPYEEMFKEGDVFIFPEKFNGLSLPLQEAFASGMLVMAGDRYPINTWLPKEPLIPVKSYKKEKIAVEFQSASYDPKEIAKKIDEWYGKDISAFSLKGKKWAMENSWEKLMKEYVEIICKL